MRVLDLGCGRALSSIYLAREHGVHVMACDLWVAAGDNWQRVVAAGVADRVTPIQAEAHALPFAETFFDAIVSLDAYTYFGTDDLYLGYIVRYLVRRRPDRHRGARPDARDPHAACPSDAARRRMAAAFWEPDCWCFHTAAWWHRHWQRTGLVDAIETEALEDGWRHWAQHERAIEASGLGAVPLRCRGDRGGSRPHARLRARDRAAQARRRGAGRGAACLGARLPGQSDALFAARDRRPGAEETS